MTARTPGGAFDPSHAEWRTIIAVGIVIDDFTPAELSKFSHKPMSTVFVALGWATDNGIFVDGAVDVREAAVLLADLGPERVAAVHTAVVRNLLADGWNDIDAIERHTTAAGELCPINEVVELLEHSAEVALSTSQYEAALRLLRLSDRFSHAESLTQRSLHCLRLAHAFAGLGRTPESRDMAARAFDFAEIAGDTKTASTAAVFGAFPVNWHAGDLRTTSILQRAERMDLDDCTLAAIRAARAIAEMRLPVVVAGDQQVAWVTRASVAQPLAEEALKATEHCAPEHRLVALLAWRNCHRAPHHLEQRRRVSIEALDLSQQLRRHDLQVETAFLLAADAIESGDRSLHDRAMLVARSVSERDGNPRLRAQTKALEAACQFLDGALTQGQLTFAEAASIAAASDLNFTLSISHLGLAQMYAYHDDPPPLEMMPESDHPVLSHPISQVATAIGWARLGVDDKAIALIERALRLLDEESSMLLSLCLAAEAAAQIHAPLIRCQLIESLEPWSDHIAVDSHGWWCAGPVAAALAVLYQAEEHVEASHRMAEKAHQLAQAIGDVRTLRRLDALGLAPSDVHDRQSAIDLTRRQLDVLQRLADGASNREIAADLAYSVSTVKADVARIFAILGTTNRAHAAKRGSELGLVDFAQTTEPQP